MGSRTRSLSAIIGAAAAVGLISMTQDFEGRSNAPYKDIRGTWTVCDGQTGVPMRHYSNMECDAFLSKTLASVASQLEVKIPIFDKLKDGEKIGAIDLSYNVGVTSFMRSGGATSTIARLYTANSFPAACEAFLGYRLVRGIAKVETAYSRRASQGKVAYKDCSVHENLCYGLWSRRLAEREVCLNG